MTDDKKHALEQTILQIEKRIRQGFYNEIRKLRGFSQYRSYTYGMFAFRYGSGRRRFAQRQNHRDLRTGSIR